MNERSNRNDRGDSRGRRRPTDGRGGARDGRSGGARRKPPTDLEELHPQEEVPDIETFTEWELGEDIQQAIRDMGITTPTPIQRLAIGPVLAGKDVIAKAETGTGKTLAFGGPMIARMDPERSTVLGMVLCPTRELAQQVADVLEALGASRNLRVALVVGGDKIDPQIRALQAGAQVIVGTPGRVLDLYNQRFLQFPWTETVVLDEADKMFEIGFIDDIRKILSYTPEERQTLLFSATFPPEVLQLAREQTTDPVEVATAKGTTTVTNIHQHFLKMDEDDCPIALVRLLEQSAPDDVFLVFCERRTDVDRLMRRLERLPFMIKALHGGYDQAARFRVMSAFRTGEVKALVATDVAARGLDVNHVTHVVNFAVPRELEDYTHRIGRTGRAGRDGTAITFVTPRDGRRWRELTSRVTWDIGEMPMPDRGVRRGPRREGRDDERPRRPSARDRDEGRPRRSPEEGEERPRRRSEHEGERPRRPAEASDGASARSRRGGEDRDARPPRDPDARPRAGGRTEGTDAAAPSRRARRDEGDERPARRREADERAPRGRGRRDEEGARSPRRAEPERAERSARRGDREADAPRAERRPRASEPAVPPLPVDSVDEVPFGWLPPGEEAAREEPRPRRRRPARTRTETEPEAEPEKEVRPAPRRGEGGEGGFGAGL